jgi:uncharacterized protein (DUF3820 family)
MVATMPFGRHQGCEVNRLPLSYLRWIRNNIPLRGWLREAVETVLAGRPYLDASDLDRLVDEIVKDAEHHLRAYQQASGHDEPQRSVGSG